MTGMVTSDPSVEMNDHVDRLQSLISQRLPLAATMQACIEGYKDGVLTVSAPLATNANHYGTAFGGSLYNLALLASWGLLYTTLVDAALKANPVIQHGDADYRRPVTDDPLIAKASFADSGGAEPFLDAVQRGERAPACVIARIGAGNEDGFILTGRYVAHRAD